jgi:hypothetical protein
LINHSVVFYFLRLEFYDINKFGNVHTKITTSRAVEYFSKVSDVRLPKIIPRLMQEFIINGADYESI